MKFPRPYSLMELADLAGRRIRARLAELGSPDIPFDIEVFGDPGTEVRAARVAFDGYAGTADEKSLVVLEAMERFPTDEERQGWSA